MLKRIFFFLLMNIAVLFVINISFTLLVHFGFISGDIFGNKASLLVYAAIVGFSGSFISLFLSKWMAKRSYNIHLITEENKRENEFSYWYYTKVKEIAFKAGIKDIEIGIYDGTPNAFATGWSKNNSLIAISTGLIDSGFTTQELEGVIGHEIAHISNGDMVTLTLLQGVINTFVVFFSRVLGEIIDKGIFKSKERGIGYFVSVFVLEIVLGFLGMLVLAYFSRMREYSADKGGAKFSTKQNMIMALEHLKAISSQNQPLKGDMAAFGIFGAFSTHPPLEKRIEALKQRN